MGADRPAAPGRCLRLVRGALAVLAVGGHAHVGRRVAPLPCGAAADIVVPLTEHDVLSATDISQHARYVLDCRRVLSGPNV